MKQLVIGAGEVGSAIAEVLTDAWPVILRDVESVEAECDVLHICFPWTPAFLRTVRTYQAEYRPTLTIIHSTVPVGTSRLLRAVHSPVTGRHPRLAESIRTFPKWFGGSGIGVAASLFEACGVDVRMTPRSETTEAGKLWQTLQFGWLVALQKEGYRWMRSVGASPYDAYRAMNSDYSRGYEVLGEPWRLPVLDDMPGPIGGHCIIPNARITDSDMARWLVELDERFTLESVA